jgi:carbon-monoxide dehydrogenase medium subunit
VQDFEFTSALTLDEAVSMLAAKQGHGRALAGGTDLLVQLREGTRSAELIVDLKRIPEFMPLEWSASRLRLGAAVPCSRIYRDQKIARHFPALVDAAKIIGGWQIQTRASIGGNLCNASPAADGIPPLLVHSAVCHLVGPSGTRRISVSEFCVGPGKNQLGAGELLVAIELPISPARAASAYERFIPRNEMDIAVVGVGAYVELAPDGATIEQARLALGAVAPTPILAEEAAAYLRGKPATEENITHAATLAKAVARPITDRRGTADYRRHLVGVLTKRTLRQAIDRAKAS